MKELFQSFLKKTLPRFGSAGVFMQGVVYKTDSSGNITGLQGPAGTSFALMNTYTWAQLQALPSPSAGDRAYVSDYGNSEWIYNGTIWTRNTPFQLLGNGIPFIMQSSCTVGAATGATSAITGLTTLTALGRGYPFNALMYFTGATATAAGLTAGWYYASVTAATTATLYNNTYSGGTPVVPASPAVFPSLAGGSYTQYAAGATKAAHATLFGKTLSPSGALRYTATYVGYSHAGAAPLQYMALGSSASNVFASAGQLSGTGTVVVVQDRILNNCGATNSQVVLNASSNSSFVANGNTGNTYLAVDTTADTDVSFGLQIAAATDWFAIDSYNLVVFPS